MTDPTIPPTADWSNRIGKVVSEGLLFSKLIAWPAFDATLAVTVAEIANGLSTASDPTKATGKSSDQAWAAAVANAIVAGLLKAGLVQQEDIDRAIEITAEEIGVTLKLGDRPSG